MSRKYNSGVMGGGGGRSETPKSTEVSGTAVVTGSLDLEQAAKVRTASVAAVRIPFELTRRG